MDYLVYYQNLIRMLLVVITFIRVLKRDCKKIAPAAIALALTFVPWLLSLMHIRINTLTGYLYPVVITMGIYLGSGFRLYDLYAWWDRCVHFLSGILFFSFGVSLTEKAHDVGLGGTLIFCFALSMALHEVWEIAEYLVDSIFHTDHQHWQKRSSVVNHQPEKAVQPPGLVDTMNDTIAGLLGTMLACAGWWIFMRR